MKSTTGNPWDRQPRESNWLAEDATLPCPSCGRPTDSLKQYRYISWGLCYLVGFTYELAYYQACPACMRKLILRRAALNVVPANVLWPLLVLPWGLGLFVASFQKGHSPSVIRGLTPEMLVAQEVAANELSWRRILAVLALLFCWFPVFGLGVAFGAWLVNRKSTDWRRRASQIAFVLGGLIHLVYLVLIIREA